MSEPLPEQLFPLRDAAAGNRYRGRVPLAGMSRLADSLAALPEGEAEVELEFGRDGEGHPFLQGRVAATVTLLCQRCLEPFSHRLEVQIALGLVTDEAQAERLPERFEPLLVGEEPVAPAELVEDELILALPIVALHADGGACRPRAVVAGPAAEPAAPRENPFAVLAGLKKPH